VSDAELLLRAAAYLRRWRVRALGESVAPDDIGDVIDMLERLARALGATPPHIPLTMSMPGDSSHERPIPADVASADRDYLGAASRAAPAARHA